MALSGSYDFAMTGDDLIQEAMERCGVQRLNVPVDANKLQSLRRTLNLKVKAGQAAGLQLHTYRDAFLFLEDGEDAYLLGPTGDNATESYVKTTLSTDEAISSTSIGLTSITGISSADKIGIELDDGTLHWDVVNGAPGAGVATLTTGLASAATAGNYVFAYTTKIQRPLKISDVFVRDVNNNDTPIELVSISDYRALSGKFSVGNPVQATYDPQLTNGRLLLWPTADDVTDVLCFTYKKPVDDFDTGMDVRASKLLTNTSNVANNDTVTVAGVVYTFKTTLTGAANEVLIGGTATISFDNLKAAINDSGAEGTDYGQATVANPYCVATTKTATTLLVEAREPGADGNALAIAEGSTVLSWTGGATVLSGGADSNSPAFPPDWYEYLVLELMPIVALKFSLPITEREQHRDMLREAKLNLWDNEETSIRIQPRRS